LLSEAEGLGFLLQIISNIVLEWLELGILLTVRSLTTSTVTLTRKTGATLKSRLKRTFQFLGRRGQGPRNRSGRGFHMVTLFPKAANHKILAGTSADFTRESSRSFEPVVAGSQIVRLATSANELDAAQALRYRVFYDEMGAHPLPEMKVMRRDFDRYDNACDHLLVVDQGRGHDKQVVGTYRIMRREHARTVGGFYSGSEYDISKLTSYPGMVMELGRSCVDADYRDRATLNLLWRGIAAYLNTHNIDLMFGCASLPGTDPDKLAVQLSYLYHYHLAPEAIRTHALPERFTNMNLLPKDAIDPKRALASLPALLKGYLRVGAFIGDGAVVDHQFNTTDVCIILKTEMIASRYTRHFDLDERQGSKSFKRAS
jgi:L-ornithine Nalpha-acyltransferase